VKKIKIAILSGGPSSEHEVSLNSAKNVLKALDLNKFEILDIKISKENVWLDRSQNLEMQEAEGIKHLKKQNVDLVFIVLHGEYGEDGTLQNLLEKEGIKYTGSNSKASKLAMDKVASSKVLTDKSLDVPSFISINEEDWQDENQKHINAAFETFGLPVVVKPTDRGSSVGIRIVNDRAKIKAAINEAFKYSQNVMVQQFVQGREITCAVLEGKDGTDIPLVPTEIIPDSTHEFFDYHAKYVKGASIEITPPDISDALIAKIQVSATRAHASIGCTGISRSDFILTDETLYILEINTIPGMTETSLLPQGAKAMGIEFSILVETIIESALQNKS